MASITFCPSTSAFNSVLTFSSPCSSPSISGFIFCYHVIQRVDQCLCLHITQYLVQFLSLQVARCFEHSSLPVRLPFSWFVHSRPFFFVKMSKESASLITSANVFLSVSDSLSNSLKARASTSILASTLLGVLPSVSVIKCACVSVRVDRSFDLHIAQCVGNTLGLHL